MIKVLRPAGASALISGQVFDDAFARNLSPDVVVEPVELVGWLDSVLGAGGAPPTARAAERFRAATAGFDFLCPNHVAIPLAPLLLELRNRSAAAIRLLLIAHAPGAYLLEWALLGPLLQPGDRIVAPTESAAGVIAALSPDLAPHVRVIPHPIRPLPTAGAAEPRYIASITRLHPDKLLHRQIEALAVLRARGFRELRMRIAGPLHAPGTTTHAPYARALAAKVQRLGLEDQVELVGAITGPAQKGQFLAGARLLINLSVTIEESFGKAIAEALGAGVPVLTTRWNGFPETVGRGGAQIAVDATRFGMDVPAERIADGIAGLLADPPDRQTCRREALRFHPRSVRRRYRQALEAARSEARAGGPTAEALAHLPAAATGLLAITAPLPQLSWGELFALHVEDVAATRHRLARGEARAPSDADELRNLLLFGAQAPLARLLADVAMEGRDQPVGDPRPVAAGGFLDKVAIAARSRATLGSRLSCLALLATRSQLAPLRAGIDALRTEGICSWGIDYLEIETLRQEGQHQRAFEISLAEDDPLALGELAAERVRQLAAVCRDWGLAGLALPWLRDWLEQFPDGPEAALIHLDRAAAAAALGPRQHAEAQAALLAARQLLGPSGHVLEVEAALQLERSA